ncbi:hypothetical protein OAS39_13140 [Pirellulales bacterium]|nr:hypothetical protein [Pirellulales bacterium]
MGFPNGEVGTVGNAVVVGVLGIGNALAKVALPHKEVGAINIVVAIARDQHGSRGVTSTGKEKQS